MIAGGEVFAAEVLLKADAMRYDPATQRIEAVGNVRFSRADGELFGERGYGDAGGTSFVLEGSVRGNFPEEKAALSCRRVRLALIPGTQNRRRVIASGDVVLTRGEDKITSQTLTWELQSENYRAEGRVKGSFTSHTIDADIVERKGERFWGKRVRRYEDRFRKITLSADDMQGLFRKDRMAELEVSGNLVVNMPDKDGNIVRVTGNKGVFSEDRGTIVVSGNALATQDGRSIRAESLVMHLDNRRVEAIGQSALTFDMKD